MAKEPESGEIVVVKVTKVLNYGAFVELLEYGNRTGFIHISQVASRWVKNIRNYVRENQIRAVQVLSVNKEKNQIDLSLSKISKQAASEKIESWKQSKRSKKLLEVLAKKEGKKFDKAWEEVAEPLLEEYDSLFEAMQQISLDGEKAVKGVPKKWLKPLVKLVQKSITVPRKTVKGNISIELEDSNAVNKIKKVLTQAPSKAGESEIEIQYSGGGTYEVKSTALDYKTAEKDLNKVKDFIIKKIEKEKGKAEFEKIE